MLLETKRNNNVYRSKATFNNSDLKVKDIGEDNNSIIIESSNSEPISLNNIESSLYIDNEDIEFSGYGKIDSNGDRIWVTNEVILKLHPSETLNSINRIIKKHKGLFIEKDKWNVITIKCASDNDAFLLANKLYESGKVKYALPNMYTSAKLHHDPLYYNQFYLHNWGQSMDGSRGLNDIDIDAPEAWKITKGSSAIKVAVIDNGVEDHEDLNDANGNSRVLKGYSASKGCTSKCKGQPKSEGDESDGHGQACAGIIAASHNHIGISGIAPNVKIIPINIYKRVYYPGGYWMQGVSNKQKAKAINTAWDDLNADVLSNSWGDYVSDDNINDAIENAISRGRNGKGSVVVFSSGNDGRGHIWGPASQPNVLTVGSISKSGKICHYSNTGDELDIVAPSSTTMTGNIRTLDREGDKGFTSGNYNNKFGGTSAAAPQAAAVAALILSINPNLSESEVRCRITSTAKDIGDPGRDDTFGYGILNANAAVSYKELKLGDEIFSGEQKLQSNKIIADDVIVDDVSNVTFQAKESITLKPGFHAEAGSDFLAYIDPYFSCDFGQLRRMIQVDNRGVTKETNEPQATYKTTFTENQDKLLDFNLNIYPNPFQQTTKIEYNLLKEEIVTISIFDIKGNEIIKLKGRDKHKTGTYSIDLNLSNYPSGTYIVMISTSEEKISKKIIKL